MCDDSMRRFAVVLCALAELGCGDGGDAGGGGGVSGQGGASAVSSTTTTSGNSSGPTGAGGCAPAANGCFEYCDFSPSSNVSFEDDVIAIFEASCNDASCHGHPESPKATLFLGLPANNDAATIAEVRGELTEDGYNAPGLQRVKPGDPENSWLMIKLDGDMGCPQSTCNVGCGQRMPRGPGAVPLPDDQLSLIRSWIMNGAPGP
jgi:hypothetical protein